MTPEEQKENYVELINQFKKIGENGNSSVLLSVDIETCLLEGNHSWLQLIHSDLSRFSPEAVAFINHILNFFPKEQQFTGICSTAERVPLLNFGIAN